MACCWFAMALPIASSFVERSPPPGIDSMRALIGLPDLAHGHAGARMAHVIVAIALFLALPLSLMSPVIAVACALSLVIAIGAFAVGLSRAGTVLFLAGVMTVPYNDVLPYPGFPWMELCDPLLLAGCTLLVPRLLGTPLRLPIGFVVGAIGLLTVGFLSAIASEQPGPELSHLVDAMRGIVFLPVFLTWWRPNRRTILAIAWAYLAGNVINVGQALIEGAGPSGRYDGFTTHPNALGLCAALAISLIPFLIATLQPTFHPLVGLAGAVCAYGVWISGSRGALLCVIMLVLLYPMLKRSIPAALTVAAAGLVAVSLVFTFAPRLSADSALGRLLGAGSASASSDVRREGAKIGFQQFLDNPMLGGGWLTVWGAHDAYIQIAAAVGIFGFVFYLIVMGSLLHPLLAVPRPYGLLAVPVLACVILDLTLPVLGARYVWVIVGLSMNAYRLAEHSVDHAPRPSTTGQDLRDTAHVATP